jgi:type IV secretion system protein VirB4
VVGGFAPRVGERHLRVVAVMGYPESSTPGRMDFLNALPFAYRWSSRFIPVGQHAAQKLIRRHQQKWFMSRRGMGSFLREVAAGRDPVTLAARERREEEFFHDRDATRMAKDALDALAENASGAVRFGFFTQTIVVADARPEVALSNARDVVTALHDHGLAARVETVNALDAFFGTLPGHGYPNLRRPLVSTANVADLWPVTSVWPGESHNPSPYFPSASPPLVHVATEGSTPFRLNLHVKDVGHTLVVGSTGAGKSTLVGLVAAQWRRYPGARTVIFDVGYSHWLLCRASGGAHYDVGAGRLDALSFQPLADVDRDEERAWAANWLEVLVELQGVEMTPAKRVRLARALALLAREPRPYRTLTELTVQVQDAELAAALAPYTVGGSYGRILDAAADALDDESSESVAPRHQVFELRHLLDLDDKVLVPVLLYLFRRVERALDGAPTLIVIEELWAPLMRTVFADRIKAWLLTMRKRNAAVMLVAHTPAQLDAVPAKQVLIESCPTRILLPNAEAANSANAGLYRDLGLNDREVAIVAGATPKRDYYVKSPLGSRLVRLELGPVALAFLGTPDGLTPEGVRGAVEQLARREGADWPRAWLARLGVALPDDNAPLHPHREEVSYASA